MKNNNIFNKKDYNSNNGFSTFVWGASTWHFLHTVSFNYPAKPTKEDKQKYYDFFQSIGDVLPCKYCRMNYKKNTKCKKFKLNKKIFKNRETLSRWLYDLHNKINLDNGKEITTTYDEVRDTYEGFRARCNKKKTQKGGKKQPKGCTEPVVGIKSKVILRVVPRNKKTKTFDIDKRCKPKKI